MRWRHKLSWVVSGWNLLFFVFIACLILLFVAFQGYVISKQSTKTIEKQYNQIMFENMDSLSVNIANSLNYIDDFARTLSNNPELIATLQHNDANAKGKIKDHIQSFSDYYHLRLPLFIQVLTNEDQMYAYPSLDAEEEQQLKQTISNFSWFNRRVSLDNNYIHSNIVRDFHHNELSNALYLSKNIIQNNLSLGLLVIEMNGSLIERMLNRAQINEQNSVFILSVDGEILFQNESSSSYASQAPTVLGTNLDTKKIYQDIKRNNADFGSDKIRSSGTMYYYKYKQIPSMPWVLVSVSPLQSLDSGSMNIWRTTMMTTGLSIILLGTFIYFLYIKVTFPIHQLSTIVKDAGEGQSPKSYPYRGFKELETLNRGIYQFFDQIQAQIETIKQGESEKRRLELHMLQSQMRPHFWHNCLNSLRFMAVLHGDRTMEDAILSLTRMLDYTLKNTDVIFSTLEEEREYALSYVRFQEIRSMQKIQVHLNLDPRSLEARIPKFTIQPILENAITHGFTASFDKEPCIQIHADVQEDKLILRVVDNGNGIEPQMLEHLLDPSRMRKSERKASGSGISLINLEQRIQLEFGKDFGIQIESQVHSCTQVKIILPYTSIEAKGDSL
ncbi:hypothetical protein Back11_36940 [Paenibacillus baekrokdamisoli]|uniref:Uncharacterized protein n=1 Tax=Paenibacillus baekrokdamisoli TaxID=1712516 RepID=A0A3G9JH53_9BACL|nr:histidine kinase [Paenibacillus baekrokdamisoli]MBB3072599.1 two-component system sensor histidine kinase YesM [Paenibacillus baekrokdamisoli]BBH22349.1 hypothetical protein Back11_36940 [Paenibacillus baekrokdamisoli]